MAGHASGPGFARATHSFPLLETPGPDQPGDAVPDPHRAGICRLVPPLIGLVRRNADGVSEGADVQRFLTHLVVDRSVAAKTQSLAYNAMALLFKHVLEHPLEDVRFARTERQQRLPVVVTRDGLH